MVKTKLLYEKESYLIRGACFAVYNSLLSGQKEVIYQRALLIELQKSGLTVENEKKLPIYYDNKKVGIYVPDFLINNLILIELKAKPFFHTDDIRQFWYYLKNSPFKLGFLVNFGNPGKIEIIRKVYDTARFSVDQH